MGIGIALGYRLDLKLREEVFDAAVAVALADHGVDAVGRHAAARGGAQVGGGEDDAGAGDTLELARHVGLALRRRTWFPFCLSTYYLNCQFLCAFLFFNRFKCSKE